VVTYDESPGAWDVLHSCCICPRTAEQLEADTGRHLNEVIDLVAALLSQGYVGNINDPGRKPAYYAATPSGREALEPMVGMEVPE